MIKVLICDGIEQQCADLLTAEGCAVDFRSPSAKEPLEDVIGEYEVLIVRSATKVTSGIIGCGKRLKIIGRAGAGVDTIDVDAATRRGIIVMNTPGGNTISTAEHAMSLLLSLARNIPQAHQSVREGKWERKKYVGVELYEKTLGIIGLGKIGKEVAFRAKGFGMKVIAFDPVLSSEAAKEIGIELVSLEHLFKCADFITVHTPLMPETKGIVGEKAFGLCKPGVRIVNAARGGIVDEGALLDALNTGIVAGAALDVFTTEPPPGAHPLVAHPHVIVTPHLGASTEEAQEKVAVQIARQIADTLHGRGVAGSVNADVIGMALSPELQPYLALAEKLGKLLIQLMEGKLRSITLRLHGALLHDATDALHAALLKGMLGTMLEEPINFVNAPVIARERGIAVHLAREADHELYTNMVSVSYETDRERRSFAGTIFGSRNLRIVKIDGFHFETNPEGYLLFYSNIDRPGVLASVSTVLAHSNINIADLSLGRYGAGKEALTVMNVDSPIPEAILQKIASVDGLLGVKLVFL